MFAKDHTLANVDAELASGGDASVGRGDADRFAGGHRFQLDRRRVPAERHPCLVQRRLRVAGSAGGGAQSEQHVAGLEGLVAR